MRKKSACIINKVGKSAHKCSPHAEKGIKWTGLIMKLTREMKNLDYRLQRNFGFCSAVKPYSHPVNMTALLWPKQMLRQSISFLKTP